MMKIKRRWVLWLRLIVYLSVMGIGAFLVRQEWRERACVAFRDALSQELRKTDTLSILYFELRNSIMEGGLDADSLHETWSKLLEESNIPLKTYTRISIPDSRNRTFSVFSKNMQNFSQTDSILSWCIGYHCEVKVTGYAFCHWWSLFVCWRLLAIGGIFVGIELSFFIFGRMYHYKRSGLPEKVEEEETSVMEIEAIDSHLYKLGANIFFDVERMLLITKEREVEIAPQVVVLLEMFLQAEGHKLSISDISRKFWSDSNETRKRMHTLIHRLRISIGELTSLEIKFKKGVYHLIIPHFIGGKGFG